MIEIENKNFQFNSFATNTIDPDAQKEIESWSPNFGHPDLCIDIYKINRDEFEIKAIYANTEDTLLVKMNFDGQYFSFKTSSSKKPFVTPIPEWF